MPDVIVISSGEPAGIGPDVCAMLAMEALPGPVVVLGDPQILQERSRSLGLDLSVRVIDALEQAGSSRPGVLNLLRVPAANAVIPGRLDRANASYVLEMLELGTELCARGSCSALVTGPVQKSLINEAGIPFTGHTEWLAERTGAAQSVMMLASASLRVALATTHLPLREVPAALDQAGLERVVRVLDNDLRLRFGIPAPRIMVLGLNPHAGERGALGEEEREIIEPVLQHLTACGLSLTGPVPADTAFTRERLRECDVVLAMYHDQGLPVIKALAFGDLVNITLGLPIIRTSVDHGTALELAGSGKARADSLRSAVRLAFELAATV
jgi:4-hydroxythreonine-4-phosphate dehydrogenase